jgi:hypothetical protein
MTKIIGFSGKKQSGKGTSANMLHGMVMKSRGMVKDFRLSDAGELIIQTTDSAGVLDWGIFDVQRRDAAFVEYADRELWPYIKMYSFADTLKWLCVDLFNIDAHKIYGNDEQKNELTQYDWCAMPGSRRRNAKLMTGREFMQHFGTNVMRKMYENVWVDNTMKRILQEGSSIAVIGDVRFPSEANAILENDGDVVRLTRNPYDDQHESELALDPKNYDQDKFTHVVDNEDSDIADLCWFINSTYQREISV